MKYSEIRKQYQHHDFLSMVLVDPYATLLSPIATKFFVKFKIIPNVVTLLMILSGIAGAAIFAVPNFICKIIGIVLIHTWYVLDCSDGEVARITKRFSKYGTEIDYTAHVINHPLMLLSFTISLLVSLKDTNSIYICLVGFILVAANLIFRNMVLFYDIYNKRENINTDSGSSSSGKVSIKQLAMFVINIFVQLPNFCLIFPIVFMFSPMIAFYYMQIVICAYIIYLPYLLARWILKIIKK